MTTTAHSRFALVVLATLVAGCPKKAESTMPATGAAPASAKAISDTMGDAPTHAVPGTITAKPPCNQGGYMKLAVAAGTAFTLDVTTSAGCANVSVTNANGGIVGDAIEVCADSPKTLPGTGQADATFVAVSETGACAGNTVTLVAK